MSLITWKKEFYSRPLKKFTRLQAIEHSLRKWEGLTRANLKKHGVEPLSFIAKVITDGEDTLRIDTTTCALCHKYQYTQPKGNFDECAACPLYETLGKGCGDGHDDDPFTAWGVRSDPKPMIKALKKCLKQNT